MSISPAARGFYRPLVSLVLWLCYASELLAIAYSPQQQSRSLPTKNTFNRRRDDSTLLYGKSNEFNELNFLVQDEDLSLEAKEAAMTYLLETSGRRRMIVFDKDGTIGNDKDSLRRWVQYMTEQLIGCFAGSLEEKNVLIEDFYASIGWDSESDDVVPSAPLAAGTWPEQISALFEFLTEHRQYLRHDFKISKEIVQKWHDDLGSLHGQDSPLIDDTRGMLQRCQELGYTVAICTSDDRPSTDTAMKFWNIYDTVEFSICANEVSEGKPSAVPLLDLCRRASSESTFGFIPQDCIVVGDTTVSVVTYGTYVKVVWCSFFSF